MTTDTITPTTRLSVVKHLASGKSPEIVATITRLDRSAVIDIGSNHGYPDTGKLAWAADVLAKKIEQEQNAIPVSEPPLPAPCRAGVVTGPRDFGSVLAARYWLTPAGIEAADRAQAAIDAGELEPLTPREATP